MPTDPSVNRHGEAAAGAPVIARKVACWVCGCDLTFNSVRLQTRAFAVHLFCRRCRRARVMELKLLPEDADALFGAEQADSPKQGEG